VPYNNEYIGRYTCRLDTNSDGNQVLTVRFIRNIKTYGAGNSGITPGGAATFVVTTKSTSNSHENKDYVNKAYITPVDDFYRGDVTLGNYTLYTVPESLASLTDENYNAFNHGSSTYFANGVENLPSVTAEARVAVSYGYATMSSTQVTEMALTSDGSALVSVAGEGEDGNNSALSSSATNYIVEADANDYVRYSLFVSNTGGSSAAKDIAKLVLVNNLPEPGDHSTLYSEFDRYSTFAVEFAPSALLAPAVSVTVDGAETPLDTSQYTLQFSTDTTFDDAEDGTSNTVWTADELGTSDGWYTLEQLAAGAADLSAMRSMRVMIADETLVPAGAQVCVSYNARLLANDADTAAGTASSGGEGVTGGTDGASDTFDTEESVAWNSFGYAYTLVNSSDPLKAAADPVGVKTTSYPVLVKQLINADGSSVQAGEAQEFEFLVYSGSAVKGLSQTMGRVAALEALAASGRQAAIVPVTVAAGASQAEVSLDGLKAWSVDGDAARATDTPFTWTNNDRYTVMELLGGAAGAANSGAGDERYTYKSINGSGAASVTFAYMNSVENEIVAVNATESFNITVHKIANDTGQALPGAWFAIYRVASTDAGAGESAGTGAKIDRTELPAEVADDLITLPDRYITGAGETWQFARAAQSDALGELNFKGLTGMKYYVVELQPPAGYSIGGASEDVDTTTDASGEGVTGGEGDGDGSTTDSSSTDDTSKNGETDTVGNSNAFNNTAGDSSQMENEVDKKLTIKYVSGSGAVINASDAIDGEAAVYVRNYSSYTLPSSGGPGTWPFVAAGLALLLAAACTAACAATRAATRARRKLGQ
jgi:hypothetical protein